jgi:hypothetical protein
MRDVHGEHNDGVTMTMEDARAELGIAAMTPQDDAVISFALKHMITASKSIQVFARLLLHIVLHVWNSLEGMHCSTSRSFSYDAGDLDRTIIKPREMSVLFTCLFCF